MFSKIPKRLAAHSEEVPPKPSIKEKLQKKFNLTEALHTFFNELTKNNTKVQDLKKKKEEKLKKLSRTEKLSLKKMKKSLNKQLKKAKTLIKTKESA